jgi:beta-N-acetylhexosaminidase
MRPTLTLEQKIGQRLVAGFPGPELNEEFKTLIRTHKIGNIILFSHNVANKRQLAGLCQELRALVREVTSYEPFITIDQEGGMVTRLSDDATNMPGAMAVAATADPGNAYTAGRITASELRALGIDFDLAPVMDVNSNPQNPVIGVRSYADDPATVARFALKMMQGLLDGGVLSAAKHFPGHGDTNLDSHLSLPVVDKSLSELERVELVPFKAAIDAGIPAIMTSHILFPQLERKNLPATMSRTIITGLLKERLGFGGLVISDCMEMAAIKQFYGTVEGTITAFTAGVDLVFISHTNSLAAQAATAIRQAVNEGRIPMEEMDASVEKILRFKQTVAQPARDHASMAMDLDSVGCEAHKQLAARMREDSITVHRMPATGLPKLGSDPWFLGCRAYRATNASSLMDPAFSFPGYMTALFGGQGTVTSINPTTEEIETLLPQALQHSCIVVGTYNGHLNTGQLDLVNTLVKSEIPVIAVALRNPYDLASLSAGVSLIAAYEYSAASFDALAKVLAKDRQATGRLSVNL